MGANAFGKRYEWSGTDIVNDSALCHEKLRPIPDWSLARSDESPIP